MSLQSFKSDIRAALATEMQRKIRKSILEGNPPPLRWCFKRIVCIRAALAAEMHGRLAEGSAGRGWGEDKPSPSEIVLEVLEVWRVDGSGPLHA